MSPVSTPAITPGHGFTEYGFLSTLADTPGAVVVSINGFDLDHHHVAAWQPRNAPPVPHRSAGIWLPAGRHVVEVEYVRNIAAGISLSRSQVSVQVRPGHTYIARPLIRSEHAPVSFAVIDHGSGFPAHCLPWSLQQSRRLDGAKTHAGSGAETVHTCRYQAQRAGSARIGTGGG